MVFLRALHVFWVTKICVLDHSIHLRPHSRAVQTWSRMMPCLSWLVIRETVSTFEDGSVRAPLRFMGTRAEATYWRTVFIGASLRYMAKPLTMVTLSSPKPVIGTAALQTQKDTTTIKNNVLRISGVIFRTAIFFWSLARVKIRDSACPLSMRPLIFEFLDFIAGIISSSGKVLGTSVSVIFDNIFLGSDTTTSKRKNEKCKLFFWNIC